MDPGCRFDLIEIHKIHVQFTICLIDPWEAPEISFTGFINESEDVDGIQLFLLDHHFGIDPHFPETV